MAIKDETCINSESCCLNLYLPRKYRVVENMKIDYPGDFSWAKWDF